MKWNSETKSVKTKIACVWLKNSFKLPLVKSGMLWAKRFEAKFDRDFFKPFNRYNGCTSVPTNLNMMF